MKITILANDFGPPWAEGGKNNARHIARTLRRSHEVLVMGLGEHTEEVEVDGMRVFRIRSPAYRHRLARVAYPMGALALLRKGGAILERERPDLLFSYFETASSALVSQVLRDRYSPASKLVHTVWADWTSVHAIPVAHWISEGLPQLLLNGQRIGRLGLGGVNKVLASSRYLVDRIETLGLSATFTPTGVDTIHFRPKPERRLGNGRLRIGYIGHLTYTKGVSLLLDAIGPILDLEPHLELVLAVTVNSEESSQVRALNHPRITLMGLVDVAETLASFDLTVVPRRFSYGTVSYPNVVLESMACGTPVLTSRLPAIDEIITDGVDGFLFRPNNGFDLKAKLLALIRDPTQLQAAGAPARARAEAMDWKIALDPLTHEIERFAR
ncbi:MAG: glycosyltransferase family 4 protein [Proteobacteria bacterium]|jgi:glycosyltransferase involved in cell wall biosynthesis|nr:glycosyltransferase family 4 protein [Pseudomonadota bacterium]